MAYCSYIDVTFPQLHARTGITQGSCISPVLFNLFVSSYPESEHLTSHHLIPQLHTRTGVPQDSCISPVLLNFFVFSYPEGEDLTTSYADDFTDSVTAVDISLAADALTEQTTHVSLWAEERGLSLSATKSSITLVTPDKRYQSHLHPNVTLKNDMLPLQINAKILGVTSDSHLYFHKHVENLCSRSVSRINIL